MELFRIFGSIFVKDEATNKLDDIDKKASNTSKSFGTLEKSSSGLGGALKNAFSFAGGLAILEGIKTGFENTISAGWQFNSTMEQNKIAFESMLGSAKKADELLNKLSKMAASTPFEFPELTTAAKKMLAFGFEADKIPDMLKKIGDAAAGLGLGAEGVNRITMALGQMKAKGKVSGEELLQLTEAGVPALDILAKAFNTTTGQVQDMASKGVLPVDQALNALVDGMETRFPNMMAAQSTSFSGLMSTLRDNIQVTFGQILQPAFEFATNTLLPNIINATSAFQQKFQETGSIMSGIQAAFQATFGDTVGTIFQPFQSTIDTLKGIVFDDITALHQVFDGLKDRFEKIFNESLPSLQVAFDTMTNTVLPAFSNINSSLFNDILPKIINIIMNIVEKVMPPFRSIFEFITTDVIPKFANAFQGYMPTISGIITNLGNVIGSVMDSVIKVFNFVWPTIKNLVSNNIDTITGVIGGLLKTLNGVLEFINGVFTGNWSQAWQGIKDIFEGLFGSVGSLMKGYINEMITGINFLINGLNHLQFDVPDWVPGIGSKTWGVNIPDIPYLAKGTDYFKGGLAIVGEQGPELVNLPTGAKVTPNKETEDMLGQNYTFNFNISNPSFRNPNDIDYFKQQMAFEAKKALQGVGIRSGTAIYAR